MDSSNNSDMSVFNSSTDSGRENGYELPVPPALFSRTFSQVTGALAWSYRYFHPKGDLDFKGDLFSIVHVVSHPHAQEQPSDWSNAQMLAFGTLSPEVSYEVHQTVRFALPIEQLSRSVYVPLEHYSRIQHDLVGLLMATELVQHVVAHTDMKHLHSLFACYYLRDGHNCCEYYLTMTD